MREVTGLSAGALDDLGILRKHAVEFAHQRLHLAGELALQARRLSRPHRGQCLLQAAQRHQGNPDLQQRHHRQARPQHSEEQPEHAGKVFNGFRDETLISGNDEQDTLSLRCAAFVLDRHHPLKRAKHRSVRTGKAVRMHFAIGRNAKIRIEQHVPQ